MSLGKAIQAARKKAGMTQVELGEAIGVSGSMIGQWENDLRNPKPETIRRIANALGDSFAELLFADSEDYEFVKLLELTNPEKLKRNLDAVKPLPDKFAALNNILNYAGFDLQLVHDQFYFLGTNGAYSLTEEQIDCLFGELVKYATYLCSTLENELVRESLSAIAPISDTPQKVKPPEGTETLTGDNK